jgi:5-formaminoimidazole-4-carboxamide-1-beta-D-ribofuranosyl 5'-monophosphate synthetase
MLCASGIIATAAKKIAIVANVDALHSPTASVGAYPTYHPEMLDACTATFGQRSALRWHRSHTASSIVLKKAYLRPKPSCRAIWCILEEPAHFVRNTPSLL